MRLVFIALSLAVIFTAALPAEFNFTFPRTRTFADTAYAQGGGTRPLGRNEPRTHDIDTLETFDFAPFRAGAAMSYATRYQWRDYTMSEGNSNLALDAYAGMYGIEASVFALGDYDGVYEHNPPHVVDYRLSYTHKLGLSINTVAYTRSDWSNSASEIGGTDNGFTPPLPNGFKEETNEISVSSYWFNDKIQSDGFNFYVGADTWFDLDDSGFRAETIAGVFTNKPGVLEAFQPNTARFAATAIYQSNYYSEESGIIGSDFYLEMGWDMRETDTPLIIIVGGEYYYPWNNDNFDDRLTLRLRVEVPF